LTTNDTTTVLAVPAALLDRVRRARDTADHAEQRAVLDQILDLAAPATSRADSRQTRGKPRVARHPLRERSVDTVKS
jgi:hypothetical protein